MRNHIYSSGLPPQAFVSLGDAIYASSPELIFVEMASLMSPAVHVLLGMELCGCFSRHPNNPRTGDITYFVEPATNVHKLRALIQSCSGIKGIKQAKKTLDCVVDNAWSPIEAVIATLLVLPIYELGYDLGPIDLNVPITTSHGATRSARRPDILFRGTSVGLNYDGLDHVDLDSVVRAASQHALMPGQMASKRELDDALHQARAGILEDKHRDRELMAQGIKALTVSKEDLFERGAFDRLVLQVISALETESTYDYSDARLALKSPLLAKLRQDKLWSLLPTNEGLRATARLNRFFALRSGTVEDYLLQKGVFERIA
ncbi:MAG: hypothetical protein IJ125_07230 [Atopobiaceae bacterium]|nr:hypothetical protein [Atopobiaceae bacterium]